MRQIKGANNQITLHFADGTQEEGLGADRAQWQTAIDQANIVIEGDDNSVELYFETPSDAQALLADKGFNILIVGNNNRLNIGRGLSVGYNPSWSMMGLHLVIGTPVDNWIAPNTSRAANNCRMDIGEHMIACGALIYLQEDGSQLRIGNDCMISWGVNIWNTDAHTIADLQGTAQNFGRLIEIGNHVWIGRDAKIGKNVRIAADSIVGWGSIVTKSFDEPNVVIAGTPAMIVKRGINWNGRTVSEYERFVGGQ